MNRQKRRAAATRRDQCADRPEWVKLGATLHGTGRANAIASGTITLPRDEGPYVVAHEAPALTDTITIVRAHGKRLAKLIRADGTVESYDNAKHFDLFTLHLRDLEAVRGLLQHLLHRPGCAVVRGEIADPYRVQRVRRLLHPDAKTGELPTMREAPRVWLALDVEGVERPRGVAVGDLPACAAETILRLPDVFRGAHCIVAASGSHGLRRDIRLRLWCWLSRATSGGELKRWLRGTPADPSVFGAAQLIYTAAPIFCQGMHDHLPQRIVELPGKPFVRVPAPEKLKPPPCSATPMCPVLRQGSARADLYVRAALRRAASRIISAERRHPIIVSEACGLARLVNAGLLGKLEMKSLLWEAAQQAGKDDESEIDRLIDFGMGHASTTPLPDGITHG